MSGGAVISVRFTSWWLGGTGASSSRGVDVAAYRDDWGCPALPMTQVQGILRESAERMRLPEVETLFGTGGARNGILRFPGDAALPLDQRDWLEANPRELAELFGVLRSTAIDDDGVALTESLRSIEVAVPLTLAGTISWDGAEDWTAWLDSVAAATPAFGKHKHDGLGRAITSVGTAR